MADDSTVSTVDAPIIGASKPSSLAASFSFIEWGYTLGGFAGSWLGGAAVGYMVQRRKQAALTGGLTASGFWSLAEAYRSAKSARWVMSLLLAVSGGSSLYLAYRRSSR